MNKTTKTEVAEIGSIVRARYMSRTATGIQYQVVKGVVVGNDEPYLLSIQLDETKEVIKVWTVDVI